MYGFTKTDIYNNALLELGQPAISGDIDDNNDASTMNILYPRVKDRELMANRWQFAIRRISLAKDTDAPAFGYTSQFSFPQDLLHPLMYTEPTLYNKWFAITSGSELPYAIENNKVLINSDGPLELVYITRNIKEHEFPPLFIDVLVFSLAMSLCATMTDSLHKKDFLVKQYQYSLSIARNRNAVIRSLEQIADGPLMYARKEMKSYVSY